MRWAVVALLLASRVWATETTVMLSGFDVCDDAAVTDSLDFAAEHISGGSIVDADVKVCAQGTSCQTHNSLNGGTAGSKKALRVDAAANELGYLSLDSGAITLNSSEVFTNLAVYMAAAPGTATRILQHREGGTTGSSTTDGCYAQVNTDLTVTVKDGAGNTFGTTAKKIQQQYCASSSNDCGTSDTYCTSHGLGDKCVSGKCQNIRTPCPSGDSSGCPSGQTCATCNTTTGAGCYWATLGLGTTTTGTGRLCELKWDGALLITGAPAAATPSNVTDVFLGVYSGLTAGTFTPSFDDFVVATGTNDIPMSRVSMLYPTVDGSPLDFTRDTCASVGTGHKDCISDYGISTFELGNGFLRTGGKNKQDVFYGLSDLTDTSSTAAAVEGVWTGDQSGTGAFSWTPRLLLCVTDAGGCTSSSTTSGACCDLLPTTISGTGNTTTRVLGRKMYESTGISSSQSWSVSNVNGLGMRFQNESTNSATNRIRAFAAYVQLTRADAPLAGTLVDHNLDGKKCLAGIGDSTCGGSLSLGCQGGTAAGQLCSQETYCDVGGNTGLTKDVPTGGCTGTCVGGSSIGAACAVDADCPSSTCTSNYQCQTCAGGVNSRKAEFNGGAGLPCGPNNGSVSCDQCGSTTNDTVAAGCCVGGSGVCGSNTGTCDGDANVALSCGCDNDCVLGVCGNCVDGDCTAGAPTNTCNDACPGTGAICPTARTSWINYVPLYVGADLILQCPGPSEPLQGMVDYRFQPITTTGQTSTNSLGSCIALVGNGACQCTTPTATADCGSGGVCTSGLCTSGDATKIACTQNSQCNVAGSRQCSFAGTCPNGMDYVIVHEGYNDFYQYSGGSDNCIGPMSLALQADDDTQPAGPCANCPVKLCLQDSDCNAANGRSNDSDCGGSLVTVTQATGNFPCSQDGVGDSPFGSVETCLLHSNPCGCTAGGACADCTTGQTCDGWTGGATKDGWCDCGADDAAPATNCTISGDSNSLNYSCKNHRCRKACTLNSQCGASGGICSSSVCEGICTCPGNSHDLNSPYHGDSCTTDADCPNFGRCSGGACICAGRPLDISTNATCQDEALEFWNSQEALYPGTTNSNNGATGTNRYPSLVRQMQTIASAANAQLILTSLTEIPLDEQNQGPHFRPNWMNKRFRQQLASTLTFPHYIDLYECFHECADVNGHTDEVHHSTSGALCLGLCVSNFLNSLNVCATDAGTRKSAARLYCETTAGVFQTTGGNDTHGGCTTVADCTAGQLCARKACTLGTDCPSTTDSCNLETGAL